jgi:hypothetical protein
MSEHALVAGVLALDRERRDSRLQPASDGDGPLLKVLDELHVMVYP